MGQLTTFTISPWKASSPIPSINLAFTLPSTAIPLKLSCLSTTSRSSSNAFRVSSIPARDRVVDFGKYKGKMLGSLPSAYLKWVSNNLRAGDMEEWAKMADQVLDDPIYRDRIEWEAAEKILKGEGASHFSSGNERNSVSELVEISERFGWDNEDKRGWSRIDFGLLGTSKGGRIPRVDESGVGILKKKREENEVEGRGRRKERRERVKRLINGTPEEEGGERSCGGVVVTSPFPGREALLKKVLNRQRLYL